MDDCLAEADLLKSKSGAEYDCVKYYLLSTAPEKGLDIGLKYVRGESLYTTCIVLI